MAIHHVTQGQNRVTLQTVARLAGVSAMTVSNAINHPDRLGEATRQRILSIITDLGYIPNLAGRHLAGAGLSRVGMIYSGVESVFINATIAAVALIAARRGIQLQVQVVAPSGGHMVNEAVRELVRLGSQGVLLVPPHAELLGTDGEPPIPAAAIATAVPLSNIFTIRIDNHAASYALTKRLLDAGRRRIAFLAGPQQHSDALARFTGFMAALEAHGIVLESRLYAEGDFTFQSGLDAARKLLELPKPPDAIVASNDDMAAAVLWLAHQRGLNLPADLAVTGFDDTLMATRVWPPLTTVRQPIQEMAERAIECLATAVRAHDTKTLPSDIVLPFELVERSSG